jgi:hypothetical protein
MLLVLHWLKPRQLHAQHTRTATSLLGMTRHSNAWSLQLLCDPGSTQQPQPHARKQLQHADLADAPLPAQTTYQHRLTQPHILPHAPTCQPSTRPLTIPGRKQQPAVAGATECWRNAPANPSIQPPATLVSCNQPVINPGRRISRKGSDQCCECP